MNAEISWYNWCMFMCVLDYLQWFLVLSKKNNNPEFYIGVKKMWKRKVKEAYHIFKICKKTINHLILYTKISPNNYIEFLGTFRYLDLVTLCFFYIKFWHIPTQENPILQDGVWQ